MADIVKYSQEQIALVKSQIAVGATNDELALFIAQCEKTGLDPFSRQIYCLGRWDQRQGRNVYTPTLSIDGARVIAQRSGEYRGQIGPLWCGQDGVWKDIWLEKTPPAAAKVGVLRAGWGEPLWAVARWESYAVTDRSGKLGPMWQKMPDLMLGKVAEMLALRRGFPMELSGLYSVEEMEQAGVQAPSIDAEVVKAKPTPAMRTTAPAVLSTADTAPAVTKDEVVQAVEEVLFNKHDTEHKRVLTSYCAKYDIPPTKRRDLGPAFFEKCHNKVPLLELEQMTKEFFGVK